VAKRGDLCGRNGKAGCRIFVNGNFHCESSDRVRTLDEAIPRQRRLACVPVIQMINYIPDDPCSPI